MKGSALERDKMLKEHEDKCTNISRSFFRCALIIETCHDLSVEFGRRSTHDVFPEVRVGKSSTDRLVNEEDI